jgi:membrane fusion protein, copper/silver efflux system
MLLGVAQSLNWIGAADPAAAAVGDDAAETIYTCPMHPQIRQPNPGRCDICGMALELATTVTADDLDEYAVHIEPVARRLANIRTAEVIREPVTQRIDSVGVIALDESRLATISAYVPGRIERLFADYTGVEVAQGDHLVVLYSPALYAAQVEYLESRRSLEAMAQAALPVYRRTQERMVETSRRKLAELAQDALALSIRPVHTMFDGDVVFALSTGRGEPAGPEELTRLGVSAVAALREAIERSVLLAAER